MARLLCGMAIVVAGCATSGGHYQSCRRCCEPDPAEAILGLGELAFQLAEAIGDRTQRAAGPPPAPMPPPLVGTVRAIESGQSLPGVAVALKGASGFVELQATTDDRGRFWFPLPLPADWYTISVDEEAFEGERRVWLKERRPLDLVVPARPKERAPAESP
jgi:hypothetical protein